MSPSRAAGKSAWHGIRARERRGENAFLREQNFVRESELSSAADSADLPMN